MNVIEQYLPEDRSDFDKDPPLQSHIYRHVMIVGEAAWILTPALKSANPDVPWRQMEGMRHIMVHDYFRVDWKIVFTTASIHIPILKVPVERMLNSLPPDGDNAILP